MRTSAIKLFGRQSALLSRVFDIQSNVNHLTLSSSFVTFDSKYYNRNTMLTVTRSNLCREFSIFNQLQQQQQQIEPIDQPIIKKWTLDSLVSDVVKEEFERQGMSDFIDNALDLLRNNFIIYLKQWKALSEQDKKKYPDGLKVILDKACSLKLLFDWNDSFQSLITLLEMFPRKDYVPTKLVGGIGSEFPVLDRNEMAEQMFKETLIRYMNRKETDKKFHNILVFAAGPGTGKSRINMEAVSLMISAGSRLLEENAFVETEKQFALELLDLLKEGIAVSITYGNGSSATGIDSVNGEYSLGRRILFEYFVGNRMNLKEFDTLLNGNYPTMDQALLVLKEYKMHHCGYKKEQVFIYVGIDEYTKYNETARKQFKIMFNDVGSAMCRSPNGVFFQSLFTGVDYRNVELITESMHTHIYLLPTLLRFESMAEIVDSISTKYIRLKSWRLSRHFKRMMADVGGHPRSFEYLLEECLKECNHYKKNIAEILSSNVSANDLWQTVVDRVKNKYAFPGIDINTMERCILDSFLQEEVTMDEELKKLYLSGLITIKPTSSIDLFFIQVPLIWFYIFSNQLRYSNVMKAIKPFLSPKAEYFEQFEKFVVDYNLLMNNLRVFRKIKEITLEEQLRGALFQNENMKKERVKLVEMNYCYSEKQYSGGKDTMIKDRESNRMIDWKDGKYFVLNAPHAPFADIFACFYLTNGDRLAHLGQLKHRNPKAITNNPKLTYSLIEKEHRKATSSLDKEQFKSFAFVMYTMDDLPNDMLNKINNLPENTAIICSSNFSKYFGSILSSRAELEYIGNRICYPNIDSKTELMAVLNNNQLCSRIIEEREKQPFKDLEDFRQRVTSGLRKDCEVYSIVKLDGLFHI